MTEQRVGEHYLPALIEHFDAGGHVSRVTVGCLLRDLKDARADLARLSAELEEARGLISELAPERPLINDSYLNCVWCDGAAGRRQLPDRVQLPDHYDGCPWVKARAALTDTAEEGS